MRMLGGELPHDRERSRQEDVVVVAEQDVG
jgi:hypothetical protein